MALHGSISRRKANHLVGPLVYNGDMLCAPSPCRQTGKCSHALRCANLKTAHDISKSNRSCKSALALACSSGKTRPINACAATNFAVRYQGNQQYSIIAMTDESGNVTERYAYDAYGVPTILDAAGVERASSTENNRFMYTGREWDEDLSLYYYRARMYDPYSGRFCSRDPIGFEGESMNLYQYVMSDPMKHTDPAGLFGVLTGPPYWPFCKWFPPYCNKPKPEPCVRFFIGYSPTEPSGNPSQDACAKSLGSKHVSVCMTECDRDRGMSTVHPGAGGGSRCKSPFSEFCEIKKVRFGWMSDSGKSCSEATPADIARCVRNTPESRRPYDPIRNNCHQDVERRTSKCCLNPLPCLGKMPGCLLSPFVR